MERKMGTLFLLILIASFDLSTSNQCLMQDVGSWNSIQQRNILDTFRGDVFNRTTTNIEGIVNIFYSEGLKKGPYFHITLADSRFLIETNDAFENYEENEILETVAATVSFMCSNGLTVIAVFLIHINDTNNNSPVFLPSNEFTYNISTPLPPGITITGCFDGITVRDIDLTTEKINFTIEDNPYFEIVYDAVSSTTNKEFIAILRSRTFVRNLFEPITLNITATDVDRTGDPPLTAVATVTFKGDTTFELPEDPVFAQAFYFANYTKDHQVILSEPISLQSGFHELVRFDLQGEYSDNFRLVPNENQLTVQNIIPLETYVLRENQIFLVVRANREYTSGDTATIILQLPERVLLNFGQSNYLGTIKNNTLQELVLSLTQDYEGEVVNTEVLGEYSQYFNTSILENSIELTMNEIPDSVINENNIISLEVVASSEFSRASTIVILEIVRDDNVTPVFSSPLYTGSYVTETGLTLGPIIFTQGYDETIELSLFGEHSTYFEPTREGPIVTINIITSIPPSILNQQHIFLTLHATKPLTVGASTAIVITFPAGVLLEFEQSNYRGTIKNNTLQELVLSLAQDYDGEVINTEVLGENSQYFKTSILENLIELTMNEIPDSVLNENNIISLEVVASSEFSRASTIVILEVIRDDNETPVFSSPLYTGSYVTETGLTLESIIFTQGYDDTIELSLSGEHSTYFTPTREGAVVTINTTTSIPPSIFNQQHILLTLHATKPLTVGASTAIVVTLPTGVLLQFEQSNYSFTIKNNTLQELVLPLVQGYEGEVINTEVLGEYSQHFNTNILENSIELTMNEIPDSVINENNIISLEVVASSEFSRASTIVILEIVRDDNVTPVFSSPLYTGSYVTETGLTLESIIFTQGYDETIELSLSGEHSTYFTPTREGAVVTINTTTSIPPSIFNQQHILLTLHATKPLTVGASTAIVITLPTGVLLQFEKSNYSGTIKNNTLQELVLPLVQGYEGEVINTEVLGEYSQHFNTNIIENSIELTMNEIPDSVLNENNIISLEVVASSEFSRASTIVILEIVRDDNVTPVFSSPLYTGSYVTETGLTLEQIIFTQGYDDTIELSLSGEHSIYFEPTREGANVTITTTTSIPPSIFNQQHILLTLHATKPLTMGASTAIVITLPAGVLLEFEQSNYRGTIKNNTLQELVLSLAQDYEGEVVNTEVLGEYSQYFNTSMLGNSIELTMNEIPGSVINQNNIISLEVVASSEFSRASTIVILEIVRDDNVTPVFSSPLYTGSYVTETGLTLEPIIFIQGYGETIELSLSGEHSIYFELTREGSNVTISTTTSIPPSIFNQQHILLTLHATKPLTMGASTAIVITLPAGVLLEFEQSNYRGTIKNNTLQELVLSLAQDYEGEVINTEVLGEYSQYFNTSMLGNSIELTINEIPISVINQNNIISLEVVASSEFSRASTIVILEIVRDDNVTPVFSSPLYTGSYVTETGLTLEPIIFIQGYGETIELSLSGEHSIYFELTREGSNVTITTTTSIPPSIFNQQHILLTLHATKPLTMGASTAIVITLPAGVLLEFEQSNYRGTIKNNTLQELVLSLAQDYEGEVINTEVLGEYSQYFNTSMLGNSIELTMNEIPGSVINQNNIISLEVVASSEFSRASTIVILEIVRDDNVTPVFSSPLYTGSYVTETGLTLEPIIFIQGYGETIELSLSGEHSIYFEPTREGSNVTITTTTSIPPSIFNQQHILLTLHATKPLTMGASTAIVITLPAGVLLEFKQSNYRGTIKNNTLQELVLSLAQDYEGEVINTEVLGEYSQYFNTSILENSIELTMNEIPDSVINENNIISLEVVASSEFSRASTIVILEIVRNDHVTPVFSSPLYTGSYVTETGLTIEPIIFIQGYGETTELSLSGEHSSYFEPTREGAVVTINTTTNIPSSIFNQQHILLTLHATKPQTMGASTALVITLPADSQTGNDVSFENLVYEGTINFSTVQHELIIISNYDGVNVVLHGVYSSLFAVSVSEGVVTIQAANDVLILPDDVTRVVLELHAIDARAVLLLAVTQSDVPVLPTVTFSSASYVLTVEAVQTGLIGRVLATADNGEAVTYSLNIDDAQLLARISINQEGELYLSAPANTGVYAFQVIATTSITQAIGTATAHLTVQAITIIDDNNIVVAPLIILNRKEEEHHNNLVLLPAEVEDCQFTLNNRWPPNQTWLYVDAKGLHTTSIDREHESIAFMPLSQVQVELILTCESDNVSRTKRSQRTDPLGPYDYDANTWILTESIPYNSRRSLVNLIVEDINDNYPIFVGKENEPIAVGYPVDELEEKILPRSLAELEATDADVGENAALMYWSSEEALAVSPTTGFVHVRTGAKLQNDQTLIVNATDQNGEGLTGNIQLVVKLLNVDNIAVVTVQNAFLDNEKLVLTQLSTAVGYELKVLRSVVISDEQNQNQMSKNTIDTSASGASLLLYIYGLLNREPVGVDQLTEDINNNAAVASVINTVSLENHLVPVDIMVTEYDIGFFVATIVLSVFLFIIIIITAIWFFLRWRKNQNYNEFSDDNSLTSGPGSVDQLPKPETPKARLNIEDLKKSEQRLQDRLNAPFETVTVEAMPPRNETPIDAIADLLSPESNTPIVIQSVDKLKDAEETDDDEFGERSGTRRKSVVTFNENVEKIIHLQNDTDSISSTSGYEIFRL